MNKKGLSAVVTTLMIILLVLVVVGILWVILVNLISEESKISEAKAKLFYERVNIKKVKFNPDDELNLIISLQKLSGGSTLKETEIIVSSPLEVDVVSVADLSGSMRACNDVSLSCCNNILNGSTYNGSVCYGIPSDGINDCTTQCGGTLADGLTPTQDANKQLVNILFEEEDNNNQMGLIAYSSDVITGFSSELIKNSEMLKNIIDSWESETYTCICCGINEAINKLWDSPENIMKTIIVMSDGEANRVCSEQGTSDAKQDAINAACDAYNDIPNVTIYTVSLGEEVDEITMESIATACGDGQSFSAYNVNELIEVYEALADHIIQKYESTHAFNLIKIRFYGESGSASRNIPVPEVLETENYNFNLTGEDIIPPIIKIEIYPVIVDRSGKEIIGIPLDIWEKK